MQFKMPNIPSLICSFYLKYRMQFIILKINNYSFVKYDIMYLCTYIYIYIHTYIQHRKWYIVYARTGYIEQEWLTYIEAISHFALASYSLYLVIEFSLRLS